MSIAPVEQAVMQFVHVVTRFFPDGNILPNSLVKVATYLVIHV